MNISHVFLSFCTPQHLDIGAWQGQLLNENSGKEKRAGGTRKKGRKKELRGKERKEGEKEKKKKKKEGEIRK